jgi:hypothetical protein
MHVGTQYLSPQETPSCLDWGFIYCDRIWLLPGGEGEAARKRMLKLRTVVSFSV